MAFAMAGSLLVTTGVAGAQSAMKPTAPQTMMSPAEAKKLRTCEALAAKRNIKMDERAKFVMDCMTSEKK